MFFSRTGCSEAELGELLVEGGAGLVVGGLGADLSLLDLAVVEGLGLDLSLLLKGGDGVSLGPASHGGELTEGAELAVGLEAESLEGIGDDHSLLHVVGEGDTFEDLELAEGISASGELVGEHATGDLPEDARGALPMLGTTAGVGVDTLLHNVLSNDLVSLEGSRLEDLLATDNGDTLAREKFLSNNTGETALEVTSSVND